MNSTRQKRSPAYPFHGELRRHPNFFFVLFGFIFLGAMAAFLLVLSSVTTNQSQDLRQRAAIQNGAVRVTVETAQLTANTTHTVPVKLTSSAPLDGIELFLRVTGPAETLKGISATSNNGVPLSVEKLHISDVTGGKAVEFIALSQNMQTGTAIPANTTLLELTLQTGTIGSITIDLDATRSTAYVFGSTQDSLNMLSSVVFPVGIAAGDPESPTPPPAPLTPDPGAPTTPAPDDLYFPNVNDLEIRKESNNELLKLDQVVSGERYKIKNRVKVQNNVKDAKSTNSTSVTVQFKANDSGISRKNFAMSQLHKSSSGLDLVFETTFVGKTSNSFKVVLDETNTIAESNENNNVLETTYSYQVVNTSATPPPVAGCNQSCQTNRDCQAGLSCSSGRCRNPRGLSSTTCQVVSTGGTTAPTKTAESTTTTGQKGSTPTKPPTTPRPSATPSATPLITPTPTVDTSVSEAPALPDDYTVPVIEPDRTVTEGIFAMLRQIPSFIQTALSQGSGLWFWLIIGGVALIFLLVVASLFGRRRSQPLPPVPPRKTILEPPASTTVPFRSLQTPASTTNVASHHNPGPQLQNPLSTSAQFSRPMQPGPNLMVQPKNVPSVTIPATATPAASSMLSRLQDRGVIKPTGVAPSTTPTNTPVSPPKTTS